MRRKLHYKDFNEFLKLYGNRKWDEFIFMFREFLDGFKTLNKEDKIQFISNIDFYILKDKERRAYINSSIRYLIRIDDDLDSSMVAFKDYYSDEYVLNKPYFPENPRGYMKIYMINFSPNEYVMNNVFVDDNPLSVV